MKIFTYASLIEEDKIRSLDEIVNCEGGRWTVAGRTVVDSHAIGSVPVRTAFSQSSNVGAAKLAVTRLTPQRFYRNLSAFGFGEQTGIDLPGESSGLLRPVKNWTAQSVASLAYGYELQCSAIQVAAAAAAIANNGIYMKPHVVKEIRNYRGEIVRQIAPQKVRRVCSPLTSQKMRALMEEVVLRGTGKSAQLEHYRAGGKTGTTIKIDPETGKYSRGNYIASFCGIAPLDDPQICVYVWIDNPKGSQYYGGQVSAPVFKEIAEAALEALKVPVRDNRPSPENVEVALERVRSRLQDEIPIDLLDPSRRDDNVSSGSMPDLTGLTMREAQDRLRTINVPIEYRGSGVVIDQMPKPYETIESGEPAVVTFGPEELYREKLARNFSKPASGLPEGVAPGYTIEPASLRLETQGKTAAVRLLDGKSAPSPSPGLSLPKPAMHATPAPTPVPDVDSRAASAPPRDGGKSTWAKALKEASKPNPETGGQRKGGDAAVSGLSPGPLKSLYDAPSPADSRNTESSQNDE
jgi:cell division protein FtsI (penicillin-binding protein 3)